jgi:hypothetical protein
MPASAYTGLETRGFVVVPGFLSSADLVEFRADYAEQPLGANRNYGVSVASARANGLLLERVTEVMREVSSQTSLRVDLPQAGAYFATGRGITFSWHQDHESFFMLGNHYDYLNFYIPIIKPDPDKSGLCVVPFDVLQRECPATYRRVVRRGASRFIRLGGRRVVFSDDSGSVHVMHKDIEKLACIPRLAAGDLLLMRGDIIHRTQDADTDRVALSFRAASSRATARRRALADGGLYKAQMMAKNPGHYERLFRAFEVTGRDEIPYPELKDILAELPQGSTNHGRDFLKFLLREKRKAGVLGRFVPKLIVGALAGQLVSAYERLRG